MHVELAMHSKGKTQIHAKLSFIFECTVALHLNARTAKPDDSYQRGRPLSTPTILTVFDPPFSPSQTVTNLRTLPIKNITNL